MRGMRCRHAELAAVFQQFVSVAAGSISTILDGAQCPRPTPTSFTVLFAEREVTFAFKTVIDDRGSLVGRVTVHLMRRDPELSHQIVGFFTFNRAGETRRLGEPNSDPIFSSRGAQSLVLDMLERSLKM